MAECINSTNDLHLCTFKMPPLGAVMSERGDADCALKMRNGVKKEKHRERVIAMTKKLHELRKKKHKEMARALYESFERLTKKYGMNIIQNECVTVNKEEDLVQKPVINEVINLTSTKENPTMFRYVL